MTENSWGASHAAGEYSAPGHSHWQARGADWMHHGRCADQRPWKQPRKQQKWLENTWWHASAGQEDSAWWQSEHPFRPPTAPSGVHWKAGPSGLTRQPQQLQWRQQQHQQSVGSGWSAAACSGPPTLDGPPPFGISDRTSHDRDIASRRVWVIGDSYLRGLQKIFRQLYATNSWTIDANEGREALSMPCNSMDAYEYIFYCSAGNGLWKDTLASVEKNVGLWDPTKVRVVLLGDAEYWSHLAGEAPKFPSFFEDAKRMLLRHHVRVLEATGLVEGIEHCDAEGHPSKEGRWDLVPRLMEIFRDITRP
mmetsp:Transcript_33466/g.92684  ORF Transcript_33466/g.92684 Transcript_33466/m.92684 type:complete len:307 (-) Transcript_33466:400-1320(-)